MSARINPLAPAIQDVMSRLRVPAVLSLATAGVRLFGDDMEVPMVLVSNQDNQGGPMSNLNGETLLGTVFLNVLAVVPAGDLELATQIDNEIGKALLLSGAYPTRANDKGEVYSITEQGYRSYVAPGIGGAGMNLYHGRYYRVRANGNVIQ